MARRDLSKTIIEGGRTGSSKQDRRLSHRKERARAREVLAGDPDEERRFFHRDKAYKEFRDKLGPLERWLRRQVGRPWDKVYSEVRDKFDVRTTPGRHVVEDHLLSSVAGADKRPFGIFTRRYKFFIDDHGLLRERPTEAREKHPGPTYTSAQIAKFLDGRLVGRRGERLFWFWARPWGDAGSTESSWKVGDPPKWEGCGHPSCGRDHRDVEAQYRWQPKREHFVGATMGPQGKRLTLEEQAWWDKMRPAEQEIYLALDGDRD